MPGTFVGFNVYYVLAKDTKNSSLEFVTTLAQVYLLTGLLPETAYNISVSAITNGGEGPACAPITAYTSPAAVSSSSSSLSGTTLGLIAAGVVIIIIILVVFFIIRGRRQSHYNQDLEFQLQSMKLGVEELTSRVKDMFSREFARTIGDNSEQSESAFAKLEIDRSKIEVGKELGKGAFGVVYKAKVVLNDGRSREVAAKTLIEDCGTDELTKFLMEARLMSLLAHPNLLELVAVVTKETPFYIITELMPKVSQLLLLSVPI